MEESEVGQEGEGSEDAGIEEDVCKEENEENGEGGHLLIVSMRKTSISVVRGRGCEDGSSFSDVIMVAESCKVTIGE